jgi:hypothetical protein
MSPKKYGARQKLNGAAIVGALIVSGFLGVASGSLAVFFVAFVVLIVAAIATGDIR